MVEFEKVCEKEKPDVVMVVGRCELNPRLQRGAKKLWIKVAPCGCRLRSFDLAMPEEINRMVTDSITDYSL